MNYWTISILTVQPQKPLLFPFILNFNVMMSALTWSWWCPGPSLWDIPRVRRVSGVSPSLALDVLDVSGVRVDEEELPDEGAVAAFLLVQAVQADPASGVTHHQPQRLPDTAEISNLHLFRKFSLQEHSHCEGADGPGSGPGEVHRGEGSPLGECVRHLRQNNCCINSSDPWWSSPERANTRHWRWPRCWCTRTSPRHSGGCRKCPPPPGRFSRPAWTRARSQCWRSRPRTFRKGRTRVRRCWLSAWDLAWARRACCRPWCRTPWWRCPLGWPWRSWCLSLRTEVRPAGPHELGSRPYTPESQHRTPEEAGDLCKVLKERGWVMQGFHSCFRVFRAILGTF